MALLTPVREPAVGVSLSASGIASYPVDQISLVWFSGTRLGGVLPRGAPLELELPVEQITGEESAGRADFEVGHPR